MTGAILSNTRVSCSANVNTTMLGENFWVNTMMLLLLEFYFYQVVLASFAHF